ncbi:transcriptional activator RfaH [Mariprofundus erugo]|uniref:Transcriptional activator RfaH n=1 Tax=Mariprofundus erugo TaxID=2528639 RepID=A0A5R9GPS2_9PROT|nr:transcriptional activator RfaH [Mariprofundus erugo]TLS66277.1 transcriptional activator RfaH [Mariprofundus erugo]TLS78302.1 transcriptional activator RfaH [Mariprofundus erugo]
MNESDSRSVWFAVRTKPRKEHVARANLEQQGIEVYLPLINTRIAHAGKVSWQPRPFFTGYLFVHLSREQQRWTTIRSTVGVLAPVVFGHFYPPIQNAVIEALQLRHDEHGYISLSQTPDAPFKPGERVRLLDGALKGLEGIFVEMRGPDRALVLLDWMQKHMRVVTATEELVSRS